MALSDYGNIDIHSDQVVTRGAFSPGIYAYAELSIGGVNEFTTIHSGDVRTYGYGSLGIEGVGYYGLKVYSGEVITHDADSKGIFAVNYIGDVLVETTGPTLTYGANSDAIYAQNFIDSQVTVVTKGAVYAYDGVGVHIDAIDGTAKLYNYNTIYGGRGGVVAYSGSGTFIDNEGRCWAAAATPSAFPAACDHRQPRPDLWPRPPVGERRPGQQLRDLVRLRGLDLWGGDRHLRQRDRRQGAGGAVQSRRHLGELDGPRGVQQLQPGGPEERPRGRHLQSWRRRGWDDLERANGLDPRRRCGAERRHRLGQADHRRGHRDHRHPGHRRHAEPSGRHRPGGNHGGARDLGLGGQLYLGRPAQGLRRL